jgi:hypothetical protein
MAMKSTVISDVTPCSLEKSWNFGWEHMDWTNLAQDTGHWLTAAANAQSLLNGWNAIKQNLKGFDDGVNQNYWVSGLCPSSGILNK